MQIEVPQERRFTFGPQVVKKRQKDISDIDQKIVSMYAKGTTAGRISDTLEDIYGLEASEGFTSDVTDKIIPQIEGWQDRPFSEVEEKALDVPECVTEKWSEEYKARATGPSESLQPDHLFLMILRHPIRLTDENGTGIVLWSS